jgi:hypothetical protein
MNILSWFKSKADQRAVISEAATLRTSARGGEFIR